MKNIKKTIALFLSLLLIFAVVVGCAPKQETPADDEKTFTLTLVYEDGKSEDLEISTSAEYLGDAMLEEELITEDEYSTGMVSTVNGVKADYNADEAWWCVYGADGEASMVGISEIPVEDGATYKFVYTIGMG